MADRSSRPAAARTSRRGVKRSYLRRRGWGPARIAPHVGLAPSTVHKILRRQGLPRLADVDLATRAELRRRVRRYEHDHPGDLVHVDIKKLGRIPDGGGWRVRGRAHGRRNAQASTPQRSASGHPVIGYAYIHTAIDDHSRLAYSEILPDERAGTATRSGPEPGTGSPAAASTSRPC